jgi:16S rRNA (adenine(1408)-N(1))-methyltransferase
MKLIKGNKTLELNKDHLNDVSNKYDTVQVDLGTGDGRFVYKKALENPQTLFIGIDPSAKQLEIYSKKALRKKLENILFILGSIENLPDELTGIANKLYVILPWGSLLQSMISPQTESIKKLHDLLKAGGEIEIILGYSPDLEPSETKRLELSEINENLIKNTVIPYFESNGFKLLDVRQLQKEELQAFESTWSKKLSHGKDRPLYLLKFSI